MISTDSDLISGFVTPAVMVISFLPIFSIMYAALLLLIEMPFYWRSDSGFTLKITYYKFDTGILNAFGITCFAFMCQTGFFAATESLDRPTPARKGKVLEILSQLFQTVDYPAKHKRELMFLRSNNAGRLPLNRRRNPRSGCNPAATMEPRLCNDSGPVSHMLLFISQYSTQFCPIANSRFR